MSPADSDRWEAFSDLECELADLTVMVDLVDNIVSDAFEDIDLHRELAGGKPDLFYLSKEHLNRILFAVRHAHDMADALEKRFLAILAGPREAGEEVRS